MAVGGDALYVAFMGTKQGRDLVTDANMLAEPVWAEAAALAADKQVRQGRGHIGHCWIAIVWLVATWSELKRRWYPISSRVGTAPAEVHACRVPVVACLRRVPHGMGSNVFWLELAALPHGRRCPVPHASYSSRPPARLCACLPAEHPSGTPRLPAARARHPGEQPATPASHPCLPAHMCTPAGRVVKHSVTVLKPSQTDTHPAIS